MHGQRVKNLLDTMSQEDLLAFEKAWRIKQAGKPIYAYQLFTLLKKPRYKDGPEENRWKKLHGSADYEPGLMRKYYHEILKELTAFLPVRMLEEDVSTQELYLLKAYNNRRQPALFASKYKAAQARLKEKAKAGFDSDDYYHAFRLSVEQQDHLIMTDPKLSKRNLHQISQSLDQWWLIQRLIISCGNLSAKQMRNVGTADRMLPLVLAYIDASPELLDTPLLLTYRTLYAYLADEPGVDVAQVLSVVHTHKSRISPSEVSTVFVLLVNALIPHLNQQGQNPQFLEALSYAYTWGLEEGLLVRNGKMVPQHFKNYISILLKQEKSATAQTFLETYGPLLPASQREAFTALNQARIAFQTGQFRSVKQQLSTHTFARTEHEISARLLLYQSEYELAYGTENWEEERTILISRLASLLQWVRRHEELSPQHQKPFLNRIKAFQALVQIKKKAALPALIEDICSRRPLDEAAWLLAKATQRLAAES